MSNEKKTFSREFKSKVVQEAVSGEQVNPVEVAEKYDVTPDQIVSWAHELDLPPEKIEKLTEATGGSHQEPGEAVIVELETSSKVFESEVKYGATYDIVNMRILTFWTIFGCIFIAVTIMIMIGLFNFGTVSTGREMSERSEYYEMRELIQRDTETLSSFGVVDLENRVFRMPIDTVISRMAQDEE